MFKRSKRKKEVGGKLCAMAHGVCIDLSEVEDEVFSSKMMGEGIAIIPSSGVLYAPCDGEIVVVMEDSKHAVGIRNGDNVEVLLHIGLETIQLNGKGFTLQCKVGQHVEVGDVLIQFDQTLLHEQGIKDTIMMVVVNDNGYQITNNMIGEQVCAKDACVISYEAI